LIADPTGGRKQQIPVGLVLQHSVSDLRKVIQYSDRPESTTVRELLNSLCFSKVSSLSDVFRLFW
jgi:hypothetical protein